MSAVECLCGTNMHPLVSSWYFPRTRIFPGKKASDIFDTQLYGNNLATSNKRARNRFHFASKTETGTRIFRGNGYYLEEREQEIDLIFFA